MSSKYSAPKGTYDLLPGDSEIVRGIEDVARDLFARSGYREIRTPVFEETELFTRSVGEATDIVNKEMYTFDDRGDRSITLRPEGTAPVSRAYIQNGMHKWPQPVKLWYSGPMFRYEAPQSGRYRQHYQVGVELIGAGDPLADAELIWLQAAFYAELGVAAGLAVSSMGDAGCRPQYIEKLKAYIAGRRDAFTEDQLKRVELNPLRAFDWAGPAEDALKEAPKLVDCLCADCRANFDSVRRYLDAVGVDYSVDPMLVRGLDYYSRTVFEFSSVKLGAQSGVGGGGRYDTLIEQLGGQPTPAAGWASGVERIQLALGEDVEVVIEADLFIVAEQDLDRLTALEVAGQLRASGLVVELDLMGRSIKAQMKQADRLGSDLTLGIDGDNAWLKDMASGEQTAGSLDGALQQITDQVKVEE